MKKSALFIICFLLVISLAAFNRVRAEVLTKDFEILKGASFAEISNKLKSEGIIRSKLIFQIYSLITGKAFKFKPGRYILNSNISLTELTKVLVNGPQEISVVISPGMTVSEIDEKLSALKIINSGELINSGRSLEGYLLPDTYHFYVGSDINLVIHRFLENFNSKALPFFNNNVNILDTLILASLLEKEIPDYEEKRIAAGILLKRLKIGMPLQVDAALLYAKCAGFLKCPKLVEADYKIDSVYNTYFYSGLPKSPISNPSLESIKAVLNYKKNGLFILPFRPKNKKNNF